MKKTYSEMLEYNTFEERYKYLRLRGAVGNSTFGFDRYFNQRFYTSRQWKRTRNEVIIRDNGCDLGIFGREIFDKILIHHMNPMSVQDLQDGNEDILDPEFLISCTHRTHNAIHYGNGRHLPRQLVTRRAGDTKLW